MSWFDPTELEILQLTHSLAVLDPNDALKRESDLRCKIFELKARRDAPKE